MNYEEFKEYVKDHILEYLPESYSAAKVTIHIRLPILSVLGITK